MRQSNLRNQIEFELSLAVKIEDIQQEIIQFKPHVIHFSGHGKEGALAFSNSEEKVDWVEIETLRGLFEIIATHVECVVLNACYSETQAEIYSRFRFLNSAPEDLQLTQHIKALLKENGVKCVLVPMERSDNLSPKDIREDIENKISGCDAVLVLCAETTAIWASKQIMDCLRLQRKRETPFKIVAIHKDKKHPDLGIDWDLLKTYICPPKHIETYLEEFIEALA